MAEYIERERLVVTLSDIIDDYKEERTFSTDFAATVVADILSDVVKSQPVADVAPVRHGVVIESIENGKMKRIFSCCGEDFTKLTMWMWPKYCPNCGAIMIYSSAKRSD